jgi:hypothetical protein
MRRAIQRSSRTICSSHLIQIITNQGVELTDGENRSLAVSIDGVNELMNLLKMGTDDIFIHLVGSTDSPLDDNLKKALLYGLLMKRGRFMVIKEGKNIIAPILEPKSTAFPQLSGVISFYKESIAVPSSPWNLENFCQWIRVGISSNQLVECLLRSLSEAPKEETLIESFRLKPHSSVVNKLFFRGKRLTDLFAATVSDLTSLADQLLKKGAFLAHTKNDPNGNGEITVRYVRMVHVVVEGGEGVVQFNFPVYYEIVQSRLAPAIPHEIDEWNRI